MSHGHAPDRQALLEEIATWRARAEEAEEALRAIREGEVDAIVVHGAQGPRLYSLTETENLYRLMIETMQEAGLATDPDGTIVFANPRFAALLQRPLRDVLGRCLQGFAHPADQAALAAVLGEAVGRPSSARVRFVAADGSELPLYLWVSFLERDAGPLVCLVGTDLTQLETSQEMVRQLQEQRQALRQANEQLQLQREELQVQTEELQAQTEELASANAALRESEARFRSLFENSLEAMFLTRPDGRVEDANAAACALFGRTRDEFLALGRAAVPVVDALQLADVLGERTRTGRVRQEMTYLRKDGSRIEADTTSVILPDAQGRSRSFVIIRDITARKRMEESLRASEEKYRLALDAAQLGTWSYNESEQTLHLGEVGRAHVGFSRAALPLAELLARVHPEDVGRLQREIAQVLDPIEGQQRFATEYRIVKPEGGVRWLAVHVRVQFDGDGPGRRPVRTFGTVQDITARKAAEESLLQLNVALEERVQQRTAQLRQRAEQLARLASELTLTEQRERRRLATVLHDHLQQLLVGASFGLQVLARQTPAEQRPQIDQVRGILDQAVQESRTLTVELAPPVLHEAGLAAALEWLSGWMRDKHGLQVELHTDAAAEPRAEHVRLFVFEAVRELLFNVVKHAGTREACVRLALAGDDRIEVVVSDEGRGIHPEAMSAVQGAGASFGLFSLRERLAVLHGELEVESAPGRGTRMRLVAPRDAGPVAG